MSDWEITIGQLKRQDSESIEQALERGVQVNLPQISGRNITFLYQFEAQGMEKKAIESESEWQQVAEKVKGCVKTFFTQALEEKALDSLIEGESDELSLDISLLSNELTEALNAHEAKLDYKKEGKSIVNEAKKAEASFQKMAKNLSLEGAALQEILSFSDEKQERVNINKTFEELLTELKKFSSSFHSLEDSKRKELVEQLVELHKKLSSSEALKDVFSLSLLGLIDKNSLQTMAMNQEKKDYLNALAEELKTHKKNEALNFKKNLEKAGLWVASLDTKNAANAALISLDRRLNPWLEEKDVALPSQDPFSSQKGSFDPALNNFESRELPQSFPYIDEEAPSFYSTLPNSAAALPPPPRFSQVPDAACEKVWEKILDFNEKTFCSKDFKDQVQAFINQPKGKLLIPQDVLGEFFFGLLEDEEITLLGGEEDLKSNTFTNFNDIVVFFQGSEENKAIQSLKQRLEATMNRNVIQPLSEKIDETGKTLENILKTLKTQPSKKKIKEFIQLFTKLDNLQNNQDFYIAHPDNRISLAIAFIELCKDSTDNDFLSFKQRIQSLSGNYENPDEYYRSLLVYEIPFVAEFLTDLELGESSACIFSSFVNRGDFSSGYQEEVILASEPQPEFSVERQKKQDRHINALTKEWLPEYHKALNDFLPQAKRFLLELANYFDSLHQKVENGEILGDEEQENLETLKEKYLEIFSEILFYDSRLLRKADLDLSLLEIFEMIKTRVEKSIGDDKSIEEAMQKAAASKDIILNKENAAISNMKL